MTRRRQWLRSEKIAVGVVAAIGIPILLFLWMLKESLVGHTTLVRVWSCTACLKDQPTVCSVFESSDFDPAFEEERARSYAWSKLCNLLEAKDPQRCYHLDERIAYTCSSKRAWRQMGGSLGRVH